MSDPPESRKTRRIWLLSTPMVVVAFLLVAWPLGAEPGQDTGTSIDTELEALEAEIDQAQELEPEQADSIDAELEALEAEIDQEAFAEDAERAESPAVKTPRPDRAPEARTTTDRSSLWSHWSLYRDPVLCALIAGAILGLLGVYVVSRRIVFVTAALSQVAALGITLGFVLVGMVGLTGLLHEALPVVLAIGMCMVVVFTLTWVGDRPSFPRDAVLGAAFVMPMALVLVLGPYIPQEMHEIESVLHGSAVVVRRSDLWAVGLAGAAVLAAQLAAFRGFVFASLDPLVAKVQGVPVRRLDIVLFGSIALMTGLVTRALGALPTFALTILPAVGAIRLKIGLSRVFVVAAITGGLAGAGGYWLAFAMDWSVGASQTLVAAGLAGLLRAVGASLERG